MLTSGTRIGAYEIEHEIGRGGMGVVYRAVDTRLGRAVAIKALPPELAADADRLARFEREARTLASLSHPNVAAIYGVEEAEGRRYLVLELVEGQTLEERIDRGALGLDEALDVCAQIAAGVEAAHEAGVVHRDLKPSNVKITDDGRVKVLDFGLAKGGDAGSSCGSEAPTLTTPAGASPTIPGAIMGTAAYMSPEQARGRRVDRRTDVWAIGVILYECLTGIGPFAGETATDSIGAVLHKDVDLARLPAGTPSGVRLVLGRCLEREKAKRWRDVGDVRVELERAREGGAEAAAIPTGGRGASRAFGVLGWVLALAAVVGVVALAMTRPAARARVVYSTIKGPEGRELQGMSISPDGTRVAVVARPIEAIGREDEDYLVYVRDLADGAWRVVDGATRAFFVEFSPDGRRLAVMCDLEGSVEAKSLRTAPADGSSAAVEIRRVDPMYRQGGGHDWFTWTASGLIAMINTPESRLDLIDPGTGEVASSVTITGESPKSIYGVLGAFGERHISVLMIRYSDRGYHEDIGLLDVQTGGLVGFVRDAGSLRRIDEQTVAFSRGESIIVSAFDPVSLRLVGELRVAEEDGRRVASWTHTWLDLSGRGDLLCARGGTLRSDRTIVVIEPDGTERVWGDETRAYEDEIAISRDGRRLAVTLASPGGNYEVWAGEVDRPRLRRIAGLPRSDVNAPMFLPDGERLIVSKQTQGEENLDFLLARFDGGGEPTPVLAEDSRMGERVWAEVRSISHDGAWAWVDWYESGRTRVVRLALDGSGRMERPLGDVTSWLPIEAPDGSGLLMHKWDQSGRPEVVVRVIRDGVVSPAIPVTAETVWGSWWDVAEDGSRSIRFVRPGGMDFFGVPIGLEEREGGPPRIVVGEPFEVDRAGSEASVTGDASMVGRYVEIRRGPNEKPWTELTLIQGWSDSIRERE